MAERYAAREATHLKALGAVVPDARAGNAHCHDACDEHDPHGAGRRAGLPVYALLDGAQDRSLSLFENLQQLLHLAVVRLVLLIRC
jgi:hypothetical protein